MEEIKKALEGVTPGPWFEGDKWVFVSPRSGLMDEALENVLRNDEAQANARYIAAVNPAAISDLLSTLKSLQRENERLERERAKQWRRARRADASRDTYSALAKHSKPKPTSCAKSRQPTASAPRPQNTIRANFLYLLRR